jgi:hypothetical protein
MQLCHIGYEEAERFMNRPPFDNIQSFYCLAVCCQDSQSVKGLSRKSHYTAVVNKPGGLLDYFLAPNGILLHFQYKWHLKIVDFRFRILDFTFEIAKV